MSRRARKRARAAAAGEARSASAPKPASRSELKNQAVREQLVPLRAGERPTAVTVAAVIAGALVISNLALAFGGYEIDGKKPAWTGVVVFNLLLGAMTYGLWRARYWAVLGMQALLALTMILFGLALPFASNARAVIVSLAVLIPCALLFWFLVKAMARIQMPERR